MKNNKSYLLLIFITAFLATSCSSNSDSFTNKGYLSKGINKIQNLFIKPSTTDETKTLEVSIAKPENQDLVFKFAVDNSALATFNESYSEKAIMLPAENYTITTDEAVITAGAVRSSEASIDFKDIASLNRETVYVLPIRVSSSHISLLQSSTLTYYVFKGAALINVVADIEKNHLQPTFKNAAPLNNLKEVTMEALMRIRDFDSGEISTIMGIEGNFLIRIGDASFERNQIQVATSAGNIPARDSSKGLPTNQWVHMALTVNTVTKEAIIYIDGKVQSSERLNLNSISLGSTNFYIGKSYDDNRWLNGDISECRIWNKVRTQEEIASSIYEVDPASEGLVSYWKFDEGTGNIVKDHTSNGNDLTANSSLKWKEVSLPE